MSLTLPFQLEPTTTLPGLQELDATHSPIEGARHYLAHSAGMGLEYHFAPGALEGAAYLTLDLMCTGTETGVFALELQEGDDGRVFQYFFATLPDASARLRMPMEAVNQNRWMYRREGALLKPRVGGQRVALSQVDRMRVKVHMLGSEPLDWYMTAVLATQDAPLLLEQPRLLEGALVDELGQSNYRNWEGKTRTTDDLHARLEAQLAEADQQRWPDGFSRYGGWTEKQYDATGFFRTQWDEEAGRWWLVDPEGYAFWSTGQDCVNPGIDANYTNMENCVTGLPVEGDPNYSVLTERRGEKYVDYLQANFMRVFGPEDWYDRWKQITLGELRRAGFNTVANWSDWRMAREAGFPYVRPLAIEPSASTPRIYRDLPDVFDPQFEVEAEAFAQQLAETRDDPALIGYFLMNEPTWGFARETPAEGMLYTSERCVSRRALADFLRERYGDDDGLSAAWGFTLSAEEVAEGPWYHTLTDAARSDLENFSELMVGRYFSTLSAACRLVDPDHLNLGIRYHTVPPLWAASGMRSFDVFSINGYREQVPGDDLKAIHDLLNLPTLIGEWHMGALDVGLPSTGVGPRVADQTARGQAYRVYLENAAALPWCVGVHHFTHYDQSALGRFDGECYNIGFYDICNRPYTPLIEAARRAHEQMYPVATGEAEAYKDAPTYYPRFFF